MDDATFQSKKDQTLSLGQFARLGQLSRKALRLYDELGILVPDYVDPSSSYRYYSPDQLERARFIRLLREMEMPLADIRRVLAATTMEEALQLVSECASDFETRVKSVRRASEKVFAYLRKETETIMFDISVKTFPAKKAITLTKRLHIGPFQAFIPEALRQISTYVVESGAKISGDPFCFYYGPLNETDDGPVEIGLPFEGEVQPDGEFQVREIPAHQGAIGTTTPEQSQFPEIIEAWDAVETWVQRNNFKLSDNPVCCYEIWHEDYRISIVQPFENDGKT